MVERPACESNSVENKGSGRTKGLRRDHVLLPLQRQATDDQNQTHSETDRYAHFRRNEIMLERVFHEKRDAKEQGQSADPCEELRAHELLPVDRG